MTAAEHEGRAGSITEKRHSGAARTGMALRLRSGNASAQTASLSSLAARKATFLLALIWIGFAGGGVAAHAGGALADLQDAEADDADALALLQVLCDLARPCRSGCASACFFDSSCSSAIAAARCLSVMVAGVAAFFAISGPPRWLNGFERRFVKPVRVGKTRRVMT